MGEYRKRAKLFHILSHPVRLQILEILARHPSCVCDLIDQTHQRQAYISQQLMLLRQAGLVRCTRQGVNIQYELAQPEIMKNLLICSLQDQPCKNSTKGDMKMSTTANNTWHGIPRDQIYWHPTVVLERCIGCGLCVTTCGRSVFAFNYESNHAVVVAPQACMVGCTTCATLCTQDAIDFPTTGFIRQIIRKNKLLTHSKNLLRSDPEKYDVKKRAPMAG